MKHESKHVWLDNPLTEVGIDFVSNEYNIALSILWLETVYGYFKIVDFLRYSWPLFVKCVNFSPDKTLSLEIFKRYAPPGSFHPCGTVYYVAIGGTNFRVLAKF